MTPHPSLEHQHRQRRNSYGAPPDALPPERESMKPTSASVRVRSGHLTTNSRANVTVDDEGDMARISVTTPELTVELVVAGEHLHQLVEQLLACQLPASRPRLELVEAAS